MKSRETAGPSFHFRQPREGPVQFCHQDVQILGSKPKLGLSGDESRFSQLKIAIYIDLYIICVCGIIRPFSNTQLNWQNVQTRLMIVMFDHDHPEVTS